MNRLEAQQRIKKYLKAHSVYFEMDIDNGVPRYTMLLHGYSSVPDNIIEASVEFYEKEIEARAYFTKGAADFCRKNREHLPALMRLFNYINAVVWMDSADGAGGTLYQPHHLYTPRLYMTEDSCFDITLTTIISYDFYAVAPLETEDYITAHCPELLAKLSPAIFGILLGRMDITTAKRYIQTNVIKRW